MATRVILGSLASGKGLRVSKPTYNALTGADADMLFDSNAASFLRVAAQGKVVFVPNTGPNTVYIDLNPYVNLGYLPFVIMKEPITTPTTTIDTRLNFTGAYTTLYANQLELTRTTSAIGFTFSYVILVR